MKAIAGLSGPMPIARWKKPVAGSGSKRCKQAQPAENPAVPVATMMAFLDSKEPMALLREELPHKEPGPCCSGRWP